MEIIQVSESEFLIGTNKIFLAPPSTVFVIAIGEQTEKIALKHREHHQILAESFSKEINYLIDLNQCGKNHPGARSVWVELSERESTRKVALVGLHPVARVIASFVMNFTKNSSTRFFSSREEAEH
ncbi:MAG: hypothetical protein JW801_11970 [Bacteroidales bacterium]|nr:hypothetical protein [Bacteroidales bacterium]